LEGNILRRNANSFIRGVADIGKIRHATSVIRHRRKNSTRTRIVELLRRLNNNWVMRVGGEAEGADRGVGGEARGLEGDDVDTVGRGLEVDQVERPGQWQRRRPLAVNLGRGHHVVIRGEGGLHHHGGTRGHHLGRVRVHILVDNVRQVGDSMTLRATFIATIRG